MDTQTLFNIATAAAGALGMWVLTGIKESLNALHKSDMDLSAKVQNIELLVAGNYAKKDDVERLIAQLTLGRRESDAALFSKLDKIESKLDTKADKATCDQLHFAKGARHE